MIRANQEPLPTPARRRPLLVAAVALLVFLAGVVWIIVGIVGVLAAHGYATVDLNPYLGKIPSIVGLGATSSALAQLAIGIVVAIVAIGLWRLSQLALVVTLIFLAFQAGEYAVAHEYGIPLAVAVVLFVALAALSPSFW